MLEANDAEAAAVGAQLLFKATTILNTVLKQPAHREDAEVHAANEANDAEAAAVAAGGDPKSKAAAAEEEKEPSRAEKFMLWFNNTWLGQRSFVKSELWW